ncbi:MAG: twitching motility protein PilT [Candidatus Omnitrophica bacterium]|nr:twitching motility protein PilT [Candidatus Omnitrophota bacterium]MCF7893744.1 twitching motility protein PilT [Candidatus Omnitrophota bacterium]
MWGLVFLRIFFVFMFVILGFSLGNGNSLLFAGIGFGVGVFFVLLETLGRKVSLKGLSSAVFGILLGLFLSAVFGLALSQFPLSEDMSTSLLDNIKLFVTIIFVYLGLTLGIKGQDEFNVVIPYVKFKRGELREEEVIVDTSSIIDGRILDIVKTGFVEAKFIIPRFVLNEMHTLADSTDHMKRQKGKRAIEILHDLKKQPNIETEVTEEEISVVKTVDEKIIKLAQKHRAKVLTTDYNLNRIAQFQGVKVLNINDLANALKPSLIAGNTFNLKLVKEGKERNQAVGYLEDGTMVVVEGGKRLIGKTVNVEVASVLQNPSGRIIFTKLAG